MSPDIKHQAGTIGQAPAELYRSAHVIILKLSDSLELIPYAADGS